MVLIGPFKVTALVRLTVLRPEARDKTLTLSDTGGFTNLTGAESSLDAAQVQSFEQVVDRQAERLIRSLTSIFLDPELAADAAQDAFVQLYKHWDEVTKRGEPTAWLFRVAVNRCKDYRRAITRTSRLVQRLIGAHPRSEASDDWTPKADFLSILAGLPARQRIAAALYYEADFSVAEIARVMGISEGAVNSHLHRARAALRDILEAS